MKTYLFRLALLLVLAPLTLSLAACTPPKVPHYGSVLVDFRMSAQPDEWARVCFDRTPGYIRQQPWGVATLAGLDLAPTSLGNNIECSNSHARYDRIFVMRSVSRLFAVSWFSQTTNRELLRSYHTIDPRPVPYQYHIIVHHDRRVQIIRIPPTYPVDPPVLIGP